MSSDVYINLQTVLSHPGLFELNVDYNVGPKTAAEQYEEEDPDFEYIKSCMEVVLMCRFGLREYWRYVDITEERSVDGDVVGLQLHVPVGGTFRKELLEFLDYHGIGYDFFP